MGIREVQTALGGSSYDRVCERSCCACESSFSVCLGEGGSVSGVRCLGHTFSKHRLPYFHCVALLLSRCILGKLASEVKTF